MTRAELILLASRLAAQALVGFLAIVLWSRTRDSAWMLMVLGAIASYADIVYSLFSVLGLVKTDAFMPYGIPVVDLVFTNLPALFYAIAFIVMIIRKRLR